MRATTGYIPVVDNVPKKCQNTNIVGGAVDSL